MKRALSLARDTSIMDAPLALCWMMAGCPVLGSCLSCSELDCSGQTRCSGLLLSDAVCPILAWPGLSCQCPCHPGPHFIQCLQQRPAISIACLAHPTSNPRAPTLCAPADQTWTWLWPDLAAWSRPTAVQYQHRGHILGQTTHYSRLVPFLCSPQWPVQQGRQPDGEGPLLSGGLNVVLLQPGHKACQLLLGCFAHQLQPCTKAWG